MVGDSCEDLTSPNACDKIVQACCKEGICACDDSFEPTEDGSGCNCASGMTLDIFNDMCVPGKILALIVR